MPMCPSYVSFLCVMPMCPSYVSCLCVLPMCPSYVSCLCVLPIFVIVRPLFVQRVSVQSFSSNPVWLGLDENDWTKSFGLKPIGRKPVG